MIGSRRAKAALEGAVDLHVHIAPSVRDRIYDSRELVEEANAYGMRAVLLKDHDRSTVSDAWHARKAAGGVVVLGSVCLNAPAGGVNPAAAEANLEMGAGAVFLPTDSAANDRAFWSRHLPAGQDKAAAVGEHHQRKFIEHIGVLEGDGRLAQAAIDVISTCAAAGALVCTGHLSTEEVTAVVDECARQGARVSVTHAPSFTEAAPENLKQWAANGAYLELVAVMCCDSGNLPQSVRRSYAMDAALIDAVGADAFTLSSDLGQVGNPPPAVGLGLFIDGLMGEGITESDIERMTRINPASALGLETSS